ncbi:exopolysaccharide biosynthesis protein [Methylobacillus flagellatus]|uniref:exopolysaccharide biosynthesis protein n=1 Tax=Methylobacillus flagellatus TaxID=405 RepID=UPI0010F7256E|nr:exopolysaccharide biosynthesis protein [Methylobacillus flagellatus]
MKSYDELVATLLRFAEQSKRQPLTLGEALDSLDRTAFALISLILVLPFLQPLPLGPITVLGGITFATLGWQMWRGHESPRLPQKVRAISMNEKTWSVLASVSVRIVNFCHRFTRERMVHLVDGRKGQKIGAFILMAAGLLMAIPFGVLPLNNLVPGLAVLFYAFAHMERDGLMIIIAFGWLVVTVVYFSLFFLALYYLGNEALQYFQFGN